MSVDFGEASRSCERRSCVVATIESSGSTAANVDGLSAGGIGGGTLGGLPGIGGGTDGRFAPACGSGGTVAVRCGAVLIRTGGTGGITTGTPCCVPCGARVR